MIRRRPRATRADTLVPATSLFRSSVEAPVKPGLPVHCGGVTAIEGSLKPALPSSSRVAVAGSCNGGPPAGRAPGLVAAGPEACQIGRASRRERVCQYGSLSVVAVSLNKNCKDSVRKAKQPTDINTTNTRYAL